MTPETPLSQDREIEMQIKGGDSRRIQTRSSC